MRFVPGSREISLVSSLHRASTDALIEQEIMDTDIAFCIGRLSSIRIH